MLTQDDLQAALRDLQVCTLRPDERDFSVVRVYLSDSD